jgi:L-lactate utilization protein LutC
MSARDAFLERVRQALRQNVRPGEAAPVEPRKDIGYQGAGPDPVARFSEMLRAAGGQPYQVPDRAAARAQILDLVRAHSLRRVVIGRDPLLDALDLPTLLTPTASVAVVDQLASGEFRETLFAADLGISAADYLVAETGSVVFRASAAEPRTLSLLTPVHITVAQRSRLLPDLFDLFDSGTVSGAEPLPSGLTLVTGPSKTGDIELRLVTGVHGPGELHVIIVRD